MKARLDELASVAIARVTKAFSAQKKGIEAQMDELEIATNTLNRE